MKQLLLFLVISLVLLPAIAMAAPAFSADKAKPMVIVCNLSKDLPSIMIGNSGRELFYTSELGEYDTTPLVPIEDSGIFNLYIWDKDLNEWVMLYRAVSEEDYQVTLRDGKILGLVITPDNYVEDFELSYEYTGYAKIMCANLTSESQAMVEFSKQWGNHDAFWTQGLAFYTLSSFGDVGSGSYSAFWQNYDQAEEDEYYYLSDNDGNPELQEVEWGKWYIMLLHDQGESSSCSFIEITPDKSMFK